MPQIDVPTVLHLFARNRDTAVRLAVADFSGAAVEVLQFLARDDDPDVRAAALGALTCNADRDSEN